MDEEGMVSSFCNLFGSVICLCCSQSEYDSVVVECAGNLIGPLAAVVGGDAILPSLPSLLSPLIDRLVGPHLSLHLSPIIMSCEISSPPRNQSAHWLTGPLLLEHLQRSYNFTCMTIT